MSNQASDLAHAQAKIADLERSFIATVKFIIMEATEGMGFRTAEHRVEQAKVLINRFNGEKEAILKEYERKYP